VAEVLTELTAILPADEKYAEAESLARECLDIHEKDRPQNWVTFHDRSLLGGALLGQQKYADAKPLLLSGYEGMQKRADTIPFANKTCLKESLQRLVQLYEATGQDDKARFWKEKLSELD
jgi:eukaryotic-like serine/threonine-protein kinase